MTEALVFIPGIFGTRLHTLEGEEVWPPTALETKLGYGRIDKLQRGDLKVGEIIDNVLCVKFYSPIQKYFKDLGFKATGAKQLVEFPYDWRRNLFDLADQLANRLNDLAAEKIYIVAHSMGGLISRLVLESGSYVDRPWFDKIELFVALATPHNGAPLALGRILGLESAMGLSGEDFRKLSENAEYPSGYQLLPAPHEDACWDQADVYLKPLDIYDDSTATKLGLKPELVAKAKAVHDTLSNGSPPNGVRYFYFAATGHETVTRVNVVGTGKNTYEREMMNMTTTRDAGDGTVPMWSALPRSKQKQVVVNEHTGVFRGSPFKKVFFRLFGDMSGGEALEAFEDENRLVLSLSKLVYKQGENISVTAYVDERPRDEPEPPDRGMLTGTFQLVEIDEKGEAVGPAKDVAKISYKSADAPYVTIQIGPVKTSGYYRLSFKGNETPQEEPAFSVSQ